MKTRKSDKWITLLFCLFFGGMLLAFLLLPKRSFSAREKRYLAAPPVLSWETLRSGKFASAAETYVAEHLPGRDALVGLDALHDLLAGRQVTKDILRGRSGRLYEAPAPFDETTLRRSLGAINAFAGAAPCPVTLMLVPSAGSLLPEDLPAVHDPWRDGEILDAAAALAGEKLQLLDLRAAFSENDPASLFYRTDHHWTARGAWLAASLYGEKSGHAALPEEAYAVTNVPDFYGTTYARSALWLTAPETLELWDGGGRFTVENMDRAGAHEGLFYPEHLQEADKYPVYLDGNHSLVRITRPDGGGNGRLLVVRDSFANCLGCFLADSWDEVVLVDLRYYREPVSALLAAEDFDAVLIVYGLRNFMTDANVASLE